MEKSFTRKLNYVMNLKSLLFGMKEYDNKTQVRKALRLV
jgi:hypothetical protein